ncbi:hypothetical protein H2199_008069 [Coniosporium tulheliwenetii]|uniref:Uncharacterized protein n=1 Tax=Coniosporium tulheliwenetii TaxID=3383036 RepID=A0ACC2YM07_9PEZI|nr:hypothetical protein H2199_008069 [Cladosporium sp. JES 115]
MVRITRCLFTAALLWHGAFSQSQTQSAPAYTATELPFAITPDTVEGDPDYIAPIFPILPFTKYANNPILSPNPANNWESAYLYNPTAIVLNSTIFLLYRAQDANLTSSIGLAWSTDGTNFTRLSRPIIYATEPWELGGGTEDPRIVRINSTFYVTYTAYDGVKPRLCIATSTDLLTWTKRPPYSQTGSTSPSPTSTSPPREPTTPNPAPSFYHAVSPDLLNWTSLPADQAFATPLLPWENRLIEPGPRPSRRAMGAGYSVGQMLIDPSGSFRFRRANESDESYEPALRDGPVARIERPMLVPEQPEELEGLVNAVVFAEGLVQFRGRWWLYFGQADSTLGLATAEVQP